MVKKNDDASARAALYAFYKYLKYSEEDAQIYAREANPDHLEKIKKIFQLEELAKGKASKKNHRLAQLGKRIRLARDKEFFPKLAMGGLKAFCV